MGLGRTCLQTLSLSLSPHFSSYYYYSKASRSLVENRMYTVEKRIENFVKHLHPSAPPTVIDRASLLCCSFVIEKPRAKHVAEGMNGK